ncbi:MAG: DUF1501 domain-containing protein [Verrucomicrobiae bacterium]|nr:DUF1501 domain-containing protein [Verrucomicrobiae bacterium]MCP5539110.1 DUF1501 domain-containing protein [Akkermansiaceae bacterium]MCP5549761.1 DUF1501 domain-containing protein [Akkermansiaceae bacterium]
MSAEFHSPNDIVSLSRRAMLRRASSGFGMVALAGLMSRESTGALAALSGAAGERSRTPRLPPRAKNVIFCYMSGGVSQVDTFDPKPKLRALDGKPVPVKVERTQFNNNGNIFASPFEFRPGGRSGIPISDLFPHLRDGCADDLAVIRSMTSPVNEHAQGNYFFHTGFPFIGHPSAGAWVNYGLGSENRDLPGFVVLKSGEAATPHGGVGQWSSAFLPAQHQASVIQVDAPEPVANIVPRETDSLQRSRLEFIDAIDRDFASSVADAQVEAAVLNYETAYRMQAAVPSLCDLAGETDATRRLYGFEAKNPMTRHYAAQALLARRLVERGVRFVELTCLPQTPGGGQGPNPWDQHGGLKNGHSNMANQVDQPIAGLLVDLKRRGLLEETIVVWAGEFGRTPFSQGSDGRDHNPFGFSVWMAGGGFRGGTIHGETDELGYHVVEGKATIYDLWATVLHQLGLDHETLTFRHAGRDFRLTDVHGSVLREVLA